MFPKNKFHFWIEKINTQNQPTKTFPNQANTLQSSLDFTAFLVGLKIYRKNFQTPDCLHSNSTLLFEYCLSVFYSHSEHHYTNTKVVLISLREKKIFLMCIFYLHIGNITY